MKIICASLYHHPIAISFSLSLDNSTPARSNILIFHTDSQHPDSAYVLHEVGALGPGLDVDAAF